MSHLITVVRQKGGRATATTDYRSDESQVRQMCANLAQHAYAVALHSLTDDAVASIVARWENGRSKRSVQASAIPTPSPTTIEGEVDIAAKISEAVANDAEAYTRQVADDDESHHYEGRCMKCKTNRKFVGIVKELANGSKAAMGTCPECGTKITRMVARNTPVDEWTDEPVTTPTFSDAEKAAVQNMTETLNGVAQGALKTPRKRTRKEKVVKVTDAQVTEVQNLAVVECPECHTTQPIKPLPDGDAYIMQHPGGGKDTCRGSRRVVTPAEAAANG